MIWLYTPAFEIGSLSTIHIPSDQSDVDINWGQSRSFIKLSDPDYFDQIQKPYKVVVKRSMKDTIRTYTQYDRHGTDHLTYVFKWTALTENRLRAMEQFILCTEGQYIGVQMNGNFAACKIMSQNITLIRDSPSHDNSEMGSSELTLELIKGDLV